LMAGTF